ncbi:MAG: TetR/AcrR family transcriptional regulator [Massilioclostridium sp.]|jgi:AcrR family transcriptional regulator|nr:TetR/AcrR family transcriptional regulator [Massilioclostridium sp.]MEE1493056.1 TetR/AcrR family transcriptional regulator [Massilioclostridium sp.]
MGSAFSDSEKQAIVRQLKQSAQGCMRKYGIKRTTVDQLANQAGISKGAFYAFYSSKEELLFEVFQDYRDEMYQAALDILLDSTSLSERERVYRAVLEVCMRIKRSFLVTMIENGELTYLLRKLPADTIALRYRSDDQHIQYILQQSNIQTKVPPALISATIRAIFLTIFHQDSVGEQYCDEVLKLLISGVCREIL